MSYPSSEEFYKTQVTEEEARMLIELEPYKNYCEMSFEHRAQYQEKIQKFKKQLAILTEQEKPQSTEQEEKAINYWASQLADFRMKGDGEAYLLNLKEQVEAKYRASMADIETKLQQCRINRHQKESFFSGRLQNAKDQLEATRSFKSKPRIKLEMELADAQGPLRTQEEGMRKREAYLKLAKEIQARETAWRSKRWQEFEAAEAKKVQEPKPSAPPIKRKAKVVPHREPKVYELITPSYAYQYSISQTDEYKGITTKVSFALIPWSPMSHLA